MKKNMAVVDRILRIVIALILIVLFFVGPVDQPWKYVMFGVGINFSGYILFRRLSDLFFVWG